MQFLVGASLLANGGNSVSRVRRKTPSRAGSLSQWAVVAVREWDVCKSHVGASLLANGGNPVFEGEVEDAFASRLAPTGIASFGWNV